MIYFDANYSFNQFNRSENNLPVVVSNQTIPFKQIVVPGSHGPNKSGSVNVALELSSRVLTPVHRRSGRIVGNAVLLVVVVVVDDVVYNWLDGINDVVANEDDNAEEAREREVVAGNNVEVVVDDIISGDFTEDCIDDDDEEGKLFDVSCDETTVVGVVVIVIVIANGGGGDGGWEEEKEEEVGECEIIHVSDGWLFSKLFNIAFDVKDEGLCILLNVWLLSLVVSILRQILIDILSFLFLSTELVTLDVVSHNEGSLAGMVDGVSALVSVNFDCVGNDINESDVTDIFALISLVV